MRAFYKTFLSLIAVGLSSPVMAAPFDGSEPLICAAMEIQSCEAGGTCESESAEDIDAPLFLKISVKDKKITGTRPSGSSVDAKIELVRHSGNLMFLQGSQEKFGWTITIGETDGKMTLTLSDHQNGVVIFGACTQR